MQNFINYDNAALITANTTLGIDQPNTTYPPSLLVCNATTAITVTMPPVTTVLAVLPPASPGYGQAINGVGGGFNMAVFNQNGGNTVVLAAASGNTFQTTAGAIGLVTIAASVGAKAQFQTFVSQTAWYQVV